MFFGHDDKIKAFRNLIEKDKLGQAYLFYGDKGIGKTAFAKILAYALETGEFPPEGEVPVGGTLIDSLVTSRNEGESSLGIEKILGLKRFLWQKPLKSPRRVAIVADAEDLTPEAQGALLKIVEEPPEHALIIFIAHDPQVLLPPLLSRLAKIYFPRLKKSEVAEFLLTKYKASKVKANEIAELSFGRLGLALNLWTCDVHRLNGETKKNEGEETLEYFLERRILDLRRKDLEKNASALSWLLDRETLVKRYNLNGNLQKKATEWILTDNADTNGYSSRFNKIPI